MPRKPGFNYDNNKPVVNITEKDASKLRKVADVRNMRDQHQVVMNYNVGHSGLNVDGQAYPTITQKGLKDIFESCYVPFTDGNKVLVQPEQKTISQRGYGNIVKRKPVKVPKGNRPGITHQDVDTKHYTNVAVYTDFPKGSGRTDTQIVWRDGTYDEAVLSATKKLRGELPASLLNKISDYEYGEASLSAMTGAKEFGLAQANKEMMKAIAEQEAIGKTPAEAQLIRDLAIQGVPLVNIRLITEFLRNVNRQRYADALAGDLGITNPRLVEQLSAIMPDSIGLTANAQREAIRRYIEANRVEAQIAEAERNRDRPFMPGANPRANVLPPGEIQRRVAERMARMGGNIWDEFPEARPARNRLTPAQEREMMGREDRPSVNARVMSEVARLRAEQDRRVREIEAEVQRRGRANAMFPGVRSRD